MEDMTRSIDAYLLKRTILTNFIPSHFEKQEPWAFFWRVSTQEEEEQYDSDMRSVPGQKMEYYSFALSLQIK